MLGAWDNQADMLVEQELFHQSQVLHFNTQEVAEVAEAETLEHTVVLVELIILVLVEQIIQVPTQLLQ